jgi:hypothetical protein
MHNSLRPRLSLGSVLFSVWTPAPRNRCYRRGEAPKGAQRGVALDRYSSVLKRPYLEPPVGGDTLPLFPSAISTQNGDEVNIPFIRMTLMLTFGISVPPMR